MKFFLLGTDKGNIIDSRYTDRRYSHKIPDI